MDKKIIKIIFIGILLGNFYPLFSGQGDSGDQLFCLSHAEGMNRVEYFTDKRSRVLGYSYWDIEDRERIFYAKEGENERFFPLSDDRYVLEKDYVEEDCFVRRWETYTKIPESEERNCFFKTTFNCCSIGKLKQIAKGSDRFTYTIISEDEFSKKEIEIKEPVRLRSLNGATIGLKVNSTEMINFFEEKITAIPPDIVSHEESKLTSFINNQE